LLKVTDEICNFHGFFPISMSIPTFSLCFPALLPQSKERPGDADGGVSGKVGKGVDDQAFKAGFRSAGHTFSGALLAAGELNQGGE
jgi:hypothetical protein